VAHAKADAWKFRLDQEKIKKNKQQEARRVEKDRKDNEEAATRAEKHSRKVLQQEVVRAAVDTWLSSGGAAPGTSELRKWLRVYRPKKSAPGLELWNKLDPAKYNAASIKQCVEPF
jgi:hypothetical protein